jgi:hypothetical protein
LDLNKHVPYGRALILHAYGMMHDRKGTPRRARDQLEAALVIFQRLGAKKDVERTGQALAALDRSPDPAR